MPEDLDTIRRDLGVAEGAAIRLERASLHALLDAFMEGPYITAQIKALRHQFRKKIDALRMLKRVDLLEQLHHDGVLRLASDLRAKLLEHLHEEDVGLQDLSAVSLEILEKIIMSEDQFLHPSDTEGGSPNRERHSFYAALVRPLDLRSRERVKQILNKKRAELQGTGELFDPSQFQELQNLLMRLRGFTLTEYFPHKDTNFLIPLRQLKAAYTSNKNGAALRVLITQANLMIHALDWKLTDDSPAFKLLIQTKDLVLAIHRNPAFSIFTEMMEVDAQLKALEVVETRRA